MKANRSLPVLLILVVAVAGIAVLVMPERETVQEQEQRRLRFHEAASQAEPLVRAISAYTTEAGHPPAALAELVPQYLETLPATGLQECDRFEYRSLLHKQGSIVWYDLGSRQGEPWSGQSRFEEGDPDHAMLVLVLDARGRITSALVDRIPKGREAEDFAPERWKAGGDRIGMALALPDTYRLQGMPREVFERLLGPPDGSRIVQAAPWELRINCPTGLLNHDAFIYWPTGEYPRYLYGGVTEPVGEWVYVHSE
ncbi:MAG TPA: hypothetical protein ENK49_12415 [Gammaproteobacteria bacterium]|nr:hypothetical protein [Gammaproteobacteria bacterium]